MEFMTEQQISARDTTVSCMQISITVLLIHTHLLHIFSIRTSLERRIAQLQLGAPAKKRKSKYILVDEALDRLRDQYFTAGIPSVGRVLQYMDAASRQFV